jgi:hypothetical protein
MEMWRTHSGRELRFWLEPHGVTSQKTPFFIVTAVKTSNFIYINYIYHEIIYIFFQSYDTRKRSSLTHGSTRTAD